MNRCCRSILTKMAPTKPATGRFFYDLLIKCNKGNLDVLARRCRRSPTEFKMPGRAACSTTAGNC